MSASAGRVLLMPKGTYDAAVTYEMLDMVRYGRSTFVCKKTSTGNTPDANQDTDYWQLVATSGDVSGVKGDAESTYREGKVNITFADLGIDSALSSSSDNAVKNKAVTAALANKQDSLTFDDTPTASSNNPVKSDGIKTALDGKVAVSGGDTATTVTTFTSSDNDTTTDKTSNGFTTVATMTSGESHSSLFQKISKMFLNIRKLWNTVGTSALASGKTVTGLLGNTDISDIGATVTGAITKIPIKRGWTWLDSNAGVEYTKWGDIVFIGGWNSNGMFNVPGTWTTKFTMPSGYRPKDFTLGVANGQSTSTNAMVRIIADGSIQFVGSNTSDKLMAFTLVYIADN